MSNRWSPKKHGLEYVSILRPKSKPVKRRNKANLKASRVSKIEKRFSLYAESLKKLGSEY